MFFALDFSVEFLIAQSRLDPYLFLIFIQFSFILFNFKQHKTPNVYIF